MKFIPSFNIITKVMISLIIFIIGSFCFILKMNFFSNMNDASDINYLILIATAFLALIAAFEFHKANKLSSNEFILFLSNRWGSSEIIKSRQLIHEKFVESYRYEKKLFPF